MLPDTSHINYIQKDNVVYRTRYGWAIFAMSHFPWVEEVEVTIFTLIHRTEQASGIQVLHQEPGNKSNQVWDLYDHDKEKWCFTPT